MKFFNNLNRRKEFVKIFLLDQNEKVENVLTGTAISGSINVNGDSNVRRVGNLTLLLQQFDMQLIEEYLRLDKKIKILKGVENKKELIDWYNLGIYVLTEVSVNSTIEGLTLDLSFSDKMCLLNGDCGGTLPASVTFHEYVQLNEKGEKKVEKQKIFDIIQSLVIFYGGERIENVIINDIPDTIKNVMRYTGTGELYFNTLTRNFSLADSSIINNENYKVFQAGENVGYTMTDFVYPKELISSIGDTVASILDQVVELLGNYEYFYDINGRFVFQEKRNYLNTSYQVSITKENNNEVTSSTNYRVDFSSEMKSSFTFSTEKGHIVSLSKSPNICNIKNDYHLWGKKNKENEDLTIHYHLLIKEKPTITSWDVWFDENNKINLPDNTTDITKIVHYEPLDWRAELYLQGLYKLQRGERLDSLYQEIVDNFPDIYNFKDRKFKTDLLKHPTELSYFIDFLDPVGEIGKYSVDSVGYKTLSIYDDTINAIYELEIPDIVLINMDSQSQETEIQECIKKGNHYSNVEGSVYSNFSLGSVINTAQDKMRELLYQYTRYNERISIEILPCYELEPNTRITIIDRTTQTGKDYILESFSIPLEYDNTMSLSCQEAIERI